MYALFPLMLPSPGFVEWAKVSATESGSTTFYIDLDTIKKAKGFISGDWRIIWNQVNMEPYRLQIIQRVPAAR